MVAAPDLGSGGESRGGSSPPIRTFNSELRIMNFDLIRQHVVAVKDVVDIKTNENQQIIRFSRVGNVKFKKAAPALFIMAVAIVSGCLYRGGPHIICVPRPFFPAQSTEASVHSRSSHPYSENVVPCCFP